MWKKTSSNFALIRFFVNFKKNDNLVFTLSAFKMNYFRKEIRISLTAAMNESSIYSVIVLRILFNHFSVSLETSLFAKTFDFFSWDHFIKIIKNALFNADFSSISFSDHSFQRETAVFAVAADISRNEIKALKRWRSDVIDLYFKSELLKIFIHFRKLHILSLVSSVDVFNIITDFIN